MSDGPEVIISSLGSGSNGNAFLLEAGDTRVLIDAGVPIRTLLKCLTLRGVSPKDLDAILLSHEHSDHMKALTGLLRRCRPPVLATRGTLAGIDSVSASCGEEIAPLEQFPLGDVQVTPIPVNHDAREPVGFFIEAGDTRTLVMTDLGEVSEINAEYAARANHLIIESNYDEAMLRSGPYPAHLKRRIRSTDGHLSNDDCAQLLIEIISETTGSVWLSHLSENNNRPELAVQATTNLLRSKGYFREIRALPRYDGTVVTWRSSDVRAFIHQSTLPM